VPVVFWVGEDVVMASIYHRDDSEPDVKNIGYFLTGVSYSMIVGGSFTFVSFLVGILGLLSLVIEI
jgi:hypothetical protein